MSAQNIHKAPVAAILVGERDREELGDIAALAASIRSVGLLHPVVVTEALTLVAGGRRLAAVRELGWPEVPVTVVDLTTVTDVLRAEADENTERKPLTPYEASRARERRARVLADDAAKRQRLAIKERDERGRAVSTSAKLAEVEVSQVGPAATAVAPRGAAPVVVDPPVIAPSGPAPTKPADRETRKAAATGTGYSGSTLDKVDKMRTVAEKGVIPIGRGKERREVPAPEPVREVAKRGLEQVKQTGFAVEPAAKALEQAIGDYVEADPDVQAARYLKSFVDALTAVRRVYADFEPEKVAVLIDGTTAEQIERHARGLRAFADKVTRARTGLRLVEGGRK